MVSRESAFQKLLSDLNIHVNKREFYANQRLNIPPDRQVIILHNLANWVTIVFLLDIEHCFGQRLFFALGSSLEITQGQKIAYVIIYGHQKLRFDNFQIW